MSVVSRNDVAVVEDHLAAFDDLVGCYLLADEDVVLTPVGFYALKSTAMEEVGERLRELAADGALGGFLRNRPDLTTACRFFQVPIPGPEYRVRGFH